MKYEAVYKCRLCGATIIATSENVPFVDENRITNMSLGTDIYKQHPCDNGDIGLADFQGMRRVER